MTTADDKTWAFQLRSWGYSLIGAHCDVAAMSEHGGVDDRRMLRPMWDSLDSPTRCPYCDALLIYEEGSSGGVYAYCSRSARIVGDVDYATGEWMPDPIGRHDP